MFARRVLFSLSLAVGVAGCGGGCSGPTSEPEETATSEGTVGQEDPEIPIDPGPRPELVVTGDVDRHTRQVAIRVENHGDLAELASAFSIQRRNGSRWEDIDVNDAWLRFDCEAVERECISLATGAVFVPPPWLALNGPAQCECEACEAAPAGTYRFVVRSCNEQHALEGAAFVLP